MPHRKNGQGPILVVSQPKQDEDKANDQSKQKQLLKLQVREGGRLAAFTQRILDLKIAKQFRSYKHDLDTIRQTYQPNEVVGPDVFAPSLSDRIRKQVLKSDAVRAAMEELRVQNPKWSHSVCEAKAVQVLQKMEASFQENSLRGLATCVQYILQQMYTGIHLSQRELQRVKEAAVKAHEQNIPLLILPTHKSHIDYLVVSYVFFLCNISVPFIAAGDNLHIPIVGELLRRSGAFFIRRKFDNDKFYKTIFNEYITTVLANGYNLEFFVEGGRSRTGKLLRPKMGVLGVVVDSILSGKIKDAVIVPMSIGYDKVIETESYVKELLGGTKERESLRELLRNANLLALNFGRIDVRISKPYSMRDYLNEQINVRQLNPIQQKSDFRVLVQVLAFNILYRINKASVTMPTAIVVTAILTHRGRGISRAELIRKFQWIRDMIVQRGGKVATVATDDSKHTGQIIDVSLNVLGNLIGKQKNVLEPVFVPAKRFELSFYRNQIVHLFVNEGLLACSIYARNRKKLDTVIDTSQLLQDVAFLSRLLKLEFIYSTEAITEAFQTTLKQMKERGILNFIDRDGQTISVRQEGYDQFDFLCALFWPFIDAYWLMSVSLYALFPTWMIEEKSFLEKVQSLGFTLYFQGELSYYEGVSKETLLNAKLLLYEMNVLEQQIIDSKGLSVVKLSQNYQKESNLVNLVEKIGQFRREGKYSSHTNLFSEKLKAIAKLCSPAVSKL